MRKLQYIPIVFIVIAVMTGCVSTPKTPSGRPEVNVDTTDVTHIKEQLVDIMIQRGFTVTSDTTYRLSFNKTLRGGQAFLTQLTIGNSYSTTPEVEITFSIAKVGDSTHIVGQAETSTQMAFGQVRRMDITNGKTFLQIQEILNSLQP